MMHTIPATAAMLVKNSERYLSEVLSALKDFDEVLLLDNGSTDRTFEIAKGFPNVSYYKHDFIGFGPMKNLAARLAQNDWIFSIDSDEVADEALIESIRAAVLENEKEHIFSLSRLNHYHGRLIKGCGWYPDIIPAFTIADLPVFPTARCMNLWCCRRKPRLDNSMAV
nr:glycosyltransferase family 2 protein [Neisseria subflava]